MAPVTETDYSTYLRINDLLKLQIPLTHDAPDELLFIVVHQSYELWFKVVIDEIRRSRDVLVEGEPWRAISHLTRVTRVMTLLLEHLEVLETMSPEGFLSFRDPLAPASGFQSFQFRAIEFLCGVGRSEMLTEGPFDDETRRWLSELASETTLWDGFWSSVRKWSDGDVSSETPALLELYRRHDSAERSALHHVAELFMDLDEQMSLWRQRHMLMAGRQIGHRHGTGGSAGMPYLATTLSARLFPHLWEIRSEL